MKTLLPILFSFMLILSLKCPKEKDNPEPETILPPISTQGLNTVGCKIDGKVWVPFSKTSVPYLYAAVDRDNKWTFEFNASQREQTKYQLNSFEMYFKSLNKDTLFYFTNDKYGNICYYRPIDTLRAPTYITNQVLNNGYVRIIRFDSIQQIIAGTFQFTLIDTNTNIKHEITEGRFDLRFGY